MSKDVPAISEASWRIAATAGLRSKPGVVKSFTMERPHLRVVTIKDVAAKADVSVATVSYALRNAPKIPAKTRERIQAVARGLGYRPNPRVASLMAHIRQAHGRSLGERLAFVWVHTTREQVKKEAFLREVLLGARRRAEQMGFGLEEFWTDDAGMTDQRLQQIILARGITGVVLSPVTTSEASLSLQWDWDRFAVAVIGNVLWNPELNHAGHHHFLGMSMALTELRKRGFVRPAAVVETEINSRARRAWEASFLTWHPTPHLAPSLLRLHRADKIEETAAWVKSVEPDALILSSGNLLDHEAFQPWLKLGKVPLVTLYWNGRRKIFGGIDQGYGHIAGSAVDMVITQLNSNETGVPELPRMMLFPGRWICPKPEKSKAARRGARGKPSENEQASP